MFCHKCGAKLLPDSQFCAKCGTRIPKMAQPFPSPSQSNRYGQAMPSPSDAGSGSVGPANSMPPYGPAPVPPVSTPLPPSDAKHAGGRRTWQQMAYDAQSNAGAYNARSYSQATNERPFDAPMNHSSLSARIEQTVGSIPPKTLKTGLAVAGIILFVMAIVMVQRASPLKQAMQGCESRIDSETWSWEVDSEYGYFQLADSGHTLTVNGIDNYDDEILTCIFDELEMPQSVRAKILHTRALDGTLSDEWDRIKITWNFQPNEGLDIVFEEE